MPQENWSFNKKVFLSDLDVDIALSNGLDRETVRSRWIGGWKIEDAIREPKKKGGRPRKGQSYFDKINC